MRVSAPIRISLIYLAFGFAWILLSDSIVLSSGVSPEQVARLQTVKGWVFVLITSVLVYVLTREYARRKDAALAKTTALSRELQRAVEQKQAMIRELHHRVKNNLQIVVALINLTASADDLETTRRRIYAMAESHDLALALEDEVHVDIHRTIELLVARLVQPHLPPGSELEISTDLPDGSHSRLPIGHIVPLGIYLSEVVRLLMPSRPPGSSGNRFTITTAGDQSRWELRVRQKDESAGSVGPIEADPSDSASALCQALAGQLGGTVTVTAREIAMQVPVRAATDALAFTDTSRN